MKMLYAFILAAFVTFAIVLSVYALGHAESMRQCDDGSYTNKDIKGCYLMLLPELSIVPDRHATVIPQAPLAPVVEAPVVTSQGIRPPSAGSVLAETCSLYREWVRINERTMGGFEYNSVDDTKKRLMLTKIFGSGFSPYGCQ